MKIVIAVGDVFLVPRKTDGDRATYDLWEILDVNNSEPPLVYVDPCNSWTPRMWLKAADFQNMKPVKYGRMEERRTWWLGKTRELVRA